MGWVIPKKAKKAKGGAEEASEAPSEGKKTKRKKPKAKADSSSEAVADTRTIPVQDKPVSGVDLGEDLGDLEDPDRAAKPRPIRREPYVGPAFREEDGVKEGAVWSSKDGRPPEGESRPRGKEGREGREEGRGNPSRKAEAIVPGGHGPSGERTAAQPSELVAPGAENAGIPADQGMTQVMPSQQGMNQVITSVELQQRRPLPILRNLGVDQEAEAAKVAALPKYQCSTCTLGPECPEFQEGYVCAFQAGFDAFPVRDVDSVLSLMTEIVDTNKQRLRMALVQERIASSGMATPEVTRLSETVLAQASQLIQLQQEMTKVTVSVVAPQTQEGARTTGGILSRLFGGPGPSQALPEERPVVIDMNPVTPDMEPSTRALDTRDGPIELEAPQAPRGSNEG